MPKHSKTQVAFATALLLLLVGCTGETGPIGPGGADGVAGEQGPQGLVGDVGADGTQGLTGADGTVGPQGAEGPTWQVVPPWLLSEYVEGSKKWWAWSNSMAAGAGHPLDYASPGDCNMNQQGPVFFLGGSFGGESTPTGCADSSCTGTRAVVTRDCTIPEGKAIFFPLLNAQWNNVDESPLLTNQELMGNVRGLGTAAENLSVTIDGMVVPNIADYHVQTGVYEYSYVANAPISGSDGSAGFTQASDDGYYMMLSPLPVGDHTIRLTGTYNFTAGTHGFDFRFELDVTYNITVSAS